MVKSSPWRSPPVQGVANWRSPPVQGLASAGRSARIIGRVSALSAFGRASVSHATDPRRSKVTSAVVAEAEPHTWREITPSRAADWPARTAIAVATILTTPAVVAARAAAPVTIAAAACTAGATAPATFTASAARRSTAH